MDVKRLSGLSQHSAVFSGAIGQTMTKTFIETSGRNCVSRNGRRELNHLRYIVFLVVYLGVLNGPISLSADQTQSSENQSVRIRDASRTFSVEVKNSRQLRTENLILQQRDFSCGAAALATVVTYFWNDTVTESQVLASIISTLTREELEERIENGLSLTDLKRLAERAGYTAILGRLPIEKLAESKVPLLVGITVNGFDHFVVVRGVDEKYVYLADPAIGRTRTPIKEFKKQWQKNAVLAVIRKNTAPPTNSSLTLSEEEKSVGRSNYQFLRNVVGSSIPGI
jgi:uncharacterized protein